MGKVTEGLEIYYITLYVLFYQDKEFHMGNTMKTAIQLGSVAPNFSAETTIGRINFYNWLGDSWCVLFSHPKDFTPVCTTELGCAANLNSEFDRRGVKILGLSVGSLADHKRWIPDINMVSKANLSFPMIADEDHKVSELYEMIHPMADDTSTVRSVFIIDPKKKIRLIMTYPASTGRNFQEILRVIDSLQLTDTHRVATPVNWKKGEECVILPSIKQEEVAKLFPKGMRQITPYLRMTPDPSMK